MYGCKMNSMTDNISVEPEQDANSALTELDKGTYKQLKLKLKDFGGFKLLYFRIVSNTHEHEKKFIKIFKMLEIKNYELKILISNLLFFFLMILLVIYF